MLEVTNRKCQPKFSKVVKYIGCYFTKITKFNIPNKKLYVGRTAGPSSTGGLFLIPFVQCIDGYDVDEQNDPLSSVDAHRARLRILPRYYCSPWFELKYEPYAEMVIFENNRQTIGAYSDAFQNL